MNFRKVFSLNTETLYCMNTIKPYAKNPIKRFSVPLNKLNAIKNDIDKTVYIIERIFIFTKAISY